MLSSIKVGSRVRLKSGSVVMTVYGVTPDWVNVSWLENNGIVFAKVIEAALVVVDTAYEPFPLDEFRGAD